MGNYIYMKLNIKLLKTIPSMEVYSMENCGFFSTNDDKWRFSLVGKSSN